jgi:uncharacterized repeat protein (TIGR03847 family)
MRFDPPDRFVTGAVGEPGRRVFHVQAIGGGVAATVTVEKLQVAILARRVIEMLKDLGAGGSIALPEDPTSLVRSAPELAEPFDSSFRVGTIALAWDPSVKRLIVEFRDDMSEEETEAPAPISDAPGGPDVLRVSLSVEMALRFAEQALQLVAAGRQPCPNCGEPLDPNGHTCTRKAAYLN